MRALVVIAALLLVNTDRLIAGGSVEWESDALPILKKNPVLLKIVEESLDVERVGLGVRVGRDTTGKATIPELGVGARIPPFEFRARGKGSAGPYDLLLIIHDPATGLSEPGEKNTWLEIRQKQ